MGLRFNARIQQATCTTLSLGSAHTGAHMYTHIHTHLRACKKCQIERPGDLSPLFIQRTGAIQKVALQASLTSTLE